MYARRKKSKFILVHYQLEGLQVTEVLIPHLPYIKKMN